MHNGIDLGRAEVEHIFASQNGRMWMSVRTIGIARAEVKIGLATLAYNLHRLVWLRGRTASA